MFPLLLGVVTQFPSFHEQFKFVRSIDTDYADKLWIGFSHKTPIDNTSVVKKLSVCILNVKFTKQLL